MMNINRSWRELRVMLKRIFPVLSDEDFNFKEESRENMLDKLAAKLNKTRSELDGLLAELQNH